MKKTVLITAILLALSIMAAGTVGVSAESPVFDDSFDKETAKEIIGEFIELRNSIGMFFGWYEVGNTKEALQEIQNTYAEGTPEGVPDWYTYAKVKDGYGPDEVKNIIRGLFVDELAESIIDDSEAFFNRYYEENGNWYFYFYSGWQRVSYADGDRPCTYFEISELDEIKTRLEPDGKTAYVSVPVHRYYDENDGSPEEARLKTNVVFTLTKVGDSWKIAYLDFRNMIFRAETDKNKGGELTEEAVREGLIALVCDLYSMSFGMSDCRYDTYSLAPNSRYHLYKVFGETNIYMDINIYSAMEGNLKDPQIWHDYAEQFCSEEVANYLLHFKKQVRVFDGGLYFRCAIAEEHTVGREEFQYSYKMQRALTDKIEIERISDSKAVANCNITWFPEVMYAYGQPHPADTVTATVKLEYEKTGDGWKIVNTDFIDTLDREIYAGHFYNGNTSLIPDRSANPGTSDPGVFAVTVVIALALAAVLKRREQVD